MNLPSLFNRPKLTYRDKLAGFEREMFDEFHLYQEAEPDHQVFVAIAEVSGKDRFTSYSCAAALKEDIREWNRQKPGPKVFIALNLRQDFPSQWTQEPNGVDNVSLYKANGFSRVSDIILNIAEQRQAYTVRRVPA